MGEPEILDDPRLGCMGHALTNQIFSSIVGVIVVTERLAKDAEEEDISLFFSQLFAKQQARQQQLLDAFVVSRPSTRIQGLSPIWPGRHLTLMLCFSIPDGPNPSHRIRQSNSQET